MGDVKERVEDKRRKMRSPETRGSLVSFDPESATRHGLIIHFDLHHRVLYLTELGDILPTTSRSRVSSAPGPGLSGRICLFERFLYF